MVDLRVARCASPLGAAVSLICNEKQALEIAA